MPTIHTQPGSVVFGAGKNLGQIAQEKEAYTRGAEQARMDLQKQQIKNAQTERALARIDADEKETRRQQEWDAIAKRAKEAAEESKRRWEEEQRTKGEMTDYQEQIIEAKKRAEQERIDKIKRNEDMLRRISQGEPAQPAVTEPSAKDLYNEKWKTTMEASEQAIEDTKLGMSREKFRKQYPDAAMIKETPQQVITPVQKSLQDQYIEGVQKQIITIDAEYKKKLRVKAVSDVYNPKASASQNEMRIKSKYNELLKTAKEKNTEANLKLISAKSKIEVAKQKAEKEGKLTPVQQFSQASKIVESASYGETIYTARQIKWAKDIVAKYTGGAATQEKVTQEKWWNK